MSRIRRGRRGEARNRLVEGPVRRQAEVDVDLDPALLGHNLWLRPLRLCGLPGLELNLSLVGRLVGRRRLVRHVPLIVPTRLRLSPLNLFGRGVDYRLVPMRPFRFQLEPVRALSEHAEASARLALASELAAGVALGDDLDAATMRLDDARRAVPLADGSVVNAWDLLATDAYIQRRESHRTAVAEALILQERKIEAQRALLVEASQRRQTLETAQAPPQGGASRRAAEGRAGRSQRGIAPAARPADEERSVTLPERARARG